MPDYDPPNTIVPFNQWFGYLQNGWGYPHMFQGQTLPGTEDWEEPVPSLPPGAPGNVFSTFGQEGWNSYNQVNTNSIPGPGQSWNYQFGENPLFAGYPRLGWGPEGGALIPEEAANLNYPGNPIDYTDPGNIGGGWGPTPLWMHEMGPYGWQGVGENALFPVLPVPPPGDIPNQFPEPPQFPAAPPAPAGPPAGPMF